MRNRRNIYAAYTTNTYEKHRTSVTYMINLHSKHTWEAYMRKIHEKHVWETLWETKARDKYEKQTCEEQIWETNMRRIHQKHTWETQMTNMHGSKRNKYQNHTWETYMRSIFEWEIYIYTHNYILVTWRDSWESYLRNIYEQRRKHTVCGLLRSKQTGRDAHGFTQGRLRHFQIAKILRAKTFHDASSWAERNNGNNQSVPSLFANVSASVRTHAFVKAFEKTIYAAYAPQTGHDKNSHRLSTSDSLLISHVGQVVKAVEILRFRWRFGLCRCSDNRWWLRR